MNFFIGIDQTGAVTSKGTPKPLPLAFIDAREPKPRLRTRAIDGRPLTLPIFSRESLEAVLVENAVDRAHEIVRSADTGLFVDAVFGLAESLNAPSPRTLFTRAAAHEGYGLKPAAGFFAELLDEFQQQLIDKDQNSKEIEASRRAQTSNFPPYPVRHCEILAQANSVFRTHPFQKNIQCGTYRIWKELGLHGSDWLHLRYFEKKKATKPILFESYPSLMWKRLLNLRTRDRTKLKEALTAHDIRIDKADLQLMIDNADHADAAMLALGGSILLPKVKRSTSERLSKEGWILGLTEEPES